MDQDDYRFDLERKKITPYRTPTGILIGRFYVRKPIVQSFYDMERLQEALLVDTESLRKERLRVIGYVFILIIGVVSLWAIK